MSARFRPLVAATLAVLFSAIFPVDVSAQKVALLAADTAENAQDVRANLMSAGLTDVTIIDVGSGLTPTPTLVELEQAEYDVILTWSSSDIALADASALGDVLADYVDGGHGVVQAISSFSLDTPTGLGGRWRTGGYGVYSPASIEMAFQPLLVHTQPTHPVLAGVNAFTGGNLSLYIEAAPQGCADVIAHWDSGWPLVAARLGPNGGRILGLNFYPVSSASGNAQLWDPTTTDGAVLMANALRFAVSPVPVVPAGAPAVALAGADDPGLAGELRCRLQDTALFSRVGIVDVTSGTPTLASLAQYNAVLTWSGAAYGDSTAMGNVLADYVDQNRGVVQSIFRSYPDPGGLPGGRWSNGGYRPFAEGPVAVAWDLTLEPQEPGHAILSGVVPFIGGADREYSGPVSLDAASTLVANWSDGAPFITTGAGSSGGRIVGLNLFPASRDAQLIANALLFAATATAAPPANRPPTADAGADQTIEATSSTGASFTLNGSGTDPDGDPLTFTWPGAGTVGGQTVILGVAPPAAPSRTQTYTIVLTVADGNGGEATDSVNLTVTDMTAPVLHGVPSGIVAASASGPAGTPVTYGPVTAIDAVDGPRAVSCSPASSSVFPVGDTMVTCSSIDSRANGTTAAFTVRVTDTGAAKPGKVQGYGFMREDGVRYELAFSALENASGGERGGLLLRVKSEHHGRRSRALRRDDHFMAKTVDSVTFSDQPTVLFRGTGRWNGRADYRYEVFAADHGASGRRQPDTVRITVTTPGGAVVAHIGGELSGGRVQFGRGRK